MADAEEPQLYTVFGVLRGNPDLVAAVADTLDFEHKYRSLVITWAPDDRPADAQIGAVLGCWSSLTRDDPNG